MYILYINVYKTEIRSKTFRFSLRYFVVVEHPQEIFVQCVEYLIGLLVEFQRPYDVFTYVCILSSLGISGVSILENDEIYCGFKKKKKGEEENKK